MQGLPRFYVKALVILEDAVNTIPRADLKKMSQTNAKAYNRVKMSLRKNNEKYVKEIEGYRAAPDAAGADEAGASAGAGKKVVVDDDSSEDEIVIGRMGVTVQRHRKASTSSDSSSGSSSDSSTSSESETEAPSGADKWRKKAPGAAAKGGDGEGSEESDWSKGDESEESSSEEEEELKGVTGRDRWLKRRVATKEKKKGPKPVRTHTLRAHFVWSRIMTYTHAVTTCRLLPVHCSHYALTLSHSLVCRPRRSPLRVPRRRLPSSPPPSR